MEEPRPAAGAVRDASGQMVADDGLPIGEDLDGAPGGERILWRGRPSPFLSPQQALMNRYKLTSERLMIDHGFIGRRTEETDLYRVNDVAVKQNAFERILGIGDIKIFTTDASAPEKNLFNVSHPDRVKDLIRAAARIERQRRRVLLRDEV
ncbi:MAG: PH domain-containing protein [Chloroflexota bacterium]|nr:PH domain-containing protein [Chloroflexota bacterium]